MEHSFFYKLYSIVYKEFHSRAGKIQKKGLKCPMSIGYWPVFDGMLVPIQINMNTINALYGLNLSSNEVSKFLKEKAEIRNRVITSEDVVSSHVGKDLYEKIFKGYTKKQWGMDPSELDASVAVRIPTRSNKDNRYFYRYLPGDAFERLHKDV